MSHPFDGARLKIVRAQEHLDALKLEIARYLQSDPHNILPVQNEIGGWDIALAEITQQPPVRFSAIIGDCLGNVRSALDYVIWELAGTYAGRKLIAPPWGSDMPFFPICEDSDRLAKSLDRLARYKLPPAVTDEITAVQPYNAGYVPLWYLNILVNVDKHRLPLTVIGEISSIRLTIARNIPSNFPPMLTGDPNYYQPQVKTQATTFVAWQDPMMPREPVEATLADIIKCVANIIPRFNNFVI